MAARWEGDRLARLTIGWRSEAQARGAIAASGEDVEDLTAAMRALVKRLQAFAEGTEDDFRDVPVDMADCTDFQRAVLNQCRRIPRGTVCTYGALASRAGAPRAARAAGNVMARNRIPLIIPCHRVVGGGGRLGGYSAPDGLRLKRRLLQLEGAPTIWGQGDQ